MAKIDFNAVDDPNELSRLQREPLNTEINAAVERAVAAAARLGRGYLGASIVGQECARQVQYDWWCLPELPSRVRLIFDRGHAFEPLILAQLTLAGFLFAPREALEFSALDGYLAGHADGIVTSGPTMPGAYFSYPAVWECKALNAKNFRAVARNGFSVTFPRYATQVALYQHFLNKPNPALVSCVNVNTCEVLHLVLPFDAEHAHRAIGHAQAIIAATRAGELLPRFTNDSSNWRCKICQHHKRCWGRA
jgi:hypothetical protein